MGIGLIGAFAFCSWYLTPKIEQFEGRRVVKGFRKGMKVASVIVGVATVTCYLVIWAFS